VSTILKALQRVEDERPSGAASAPRRALRSDFVPERSKALLRRSRQRAPRPWLWGAAGTALLLAGLVWWRLPERSAPERSAPEREVAAEAESPAPAAPRVFRRRRPVAPASDPVEQASAVPPATATEPQPAAAAAPPPQPALPAGIAERLPPLGTTLDVPSTGTLAPAPPDPSLPAAAPQLAAAVEPAPEAGAREPAPIAVEAAPAPEPEAAPVQATPPAPPPQARPAAQPAPPAVAPKPAPPPAPSAPSVLVERTSWHPTAARRLAWVTVEGITGARELHEGDAVGALVVKEIRPSSVVFLHGADRLQRRVGQRE